LSFEQMVTKENLQQAKELYDLCKNGKAPNTEIKKKLIELYNTIHNTKYRTTTNCGSCLKTVFNGIKRIAIYGKI